jgi:hypothetical protein
VPVHPASASVEQDRSLLAVTSGAVDRAPEGGWQWYQCDLGAFAHHAQDAVAALFADVGDIGAAGFEDP